MAYFPMFVDLTDKTCLVVGGGEVAYRKVKTLLDFDAKVTVVAESVCPKLAELAEVQDKKILSACDYVTGAGEVTSEDKVQSACGRNAEKADAPKNRVTIWVRPFQKEDCDGRLLVVAATDDRELNHNIAEYCKAAGIMVNAVDQKDDCSFIFSSYVREQNLVAAFHPGGELPLVKPSGIIEQGFNLRDDNALGKTIDVFAILPPNILKDGRDNSLLLLRQKQRLMYAIPKKFIIVNIPGQSRIPQKIRMKQ